MNQQSKVYHGELPEDKLAEMAKKGRVERIENAANDKEVYVSYRIYIGEPEKEQISAWKSEYGEDRVIRVEMEGDHNEVSVVYLRKPNRIHISRAMTFIVAQKPVEAGEAILDDTWLHGDPRCKSLEDKCTDYRVGLAMLLYHETKVFNAVIKNA